MTTRPWKTPTSVLIVGLGGLGCAAADVLVRAGIARLGLVDGDRVETSNLHRQLLYEASDIGAAKVEAAREQLRKFSRGIRIDIHSEHLERGNAARLVGSYDFLIDGTDSPTAKFLLNDVALETGRPLSHAGVVGLGGQLLTIIPGASACLRCVFPEPPEEGEVLTCTAAGVLGPVAGWIGSLQGAEALAFVRGELCRFRNRWMIVDGATLHAHTVPARQRSSCVCTRARQGTSPSSRPIAGRPPPAAPRYLPESIERKPS